MLTLFIFASEPSNDDVFQDNMATQDASSFAGNRNAQNSMRRVTVTMPDVEEPSAPVQLPDLPAGWDERQVSAGGQATT